MLITTKVTTAPSMRPDSANANAASKTPTGTPTHTARAAAPPRHAHAGTKNIVRLCPAVVAAHQQLAESPPNWQALAAPRKAYAHENCRQHHLHSRLDQRNRFGAGAAPAGQRQHRDCRGQKKRAARPDRGRAPGD